MALKFGHHIDLENHEIRNVLLEILASDPGSPQQGRTWFNSNGADLHVKFHDGSAVVKVPRLDKAETVSQDWTFDRGTGAPFLVANASAAKVTNLDADKLDGFHAAQTLTVSTVVVRDGSGRIKIADPSAADDAASKGYVDAVAQGFDVKASVRVASTANWAATRTSNTLTANANGSLNTAGIDGVTTLALNDRVGLKDQSTGADNGLWVITALGSAGTPAVMVRATDADVSSEVTSGLFFSVTEGTTNGNSGWTLTTDDPITLNTTALVFQVFYRAGELTAGNGMVKVGNTFHAITSSAYTPGGLVWCSSSTALSHTGTLSGILQGNGSSAPTAITGTGGRLTKWGGSAPYLADSIISESGQVLTLNGGASTIETNTGNITIKAAGGNGNVVLEANGVGQVVITTATNGAGIYFNGNVTATRGFLGMLQASDTIFRLYGVALAHDLIRVDLAGGFIGISGGSTAAETPTTAFQVRKDDAETFSATATASADHVLRVRNLDTTANSYTGISFVNRQTGTAHSGIYAVSSGNDASDLVFVAENATPNEVSRFTGLGNLLLGITSAGTSAAKVLAIGNGTAPTTAPADIVQIYSANFAGDSTAGLHVTVEGGALPRLRFGSSAILSIEDQVADASNKVGRWGTAHYTNAEEPMALATTLSNATENVVQLGGGTSLMNAATRIDFLLAANNTTVTGTAQWRMTSGVLYPTANATSEVDAAGYDIGGSSNYVRKLYARQLQGNVLLTTVTGTAFSSKSIIYAGTSGVLSQDNSLFQYDTTTTSMGLGAAAASNTGFNLLRSGVKTASDFAASIVNSNTATTDGLTKHTLYVSASGAWGTSSGTVYGIYIATASGGVTANWALYNSSGADVFLGAGRIQAGTPTVSTSVVYRFGGAATPASVTNTTGYGLLVDPIWSTSQTSVGAAGVFHLRTVASAFTMGSGAGVLVSSPVIGAGSTVTTISGLNVTNQGVSGTTTSYGLYIDAQSGSTTNWGIYCNGSSDNYMGTARLALGATVSNNVYVRMGGTSLPSSITSTSAFGLYLDPVWSTSQTGSAAAAYFVLRTAAASFTLASGYGLYLESPNLGASSTVTAVYGIRIRNQGVSGTTTSTALYFDAQTGSTNNWTIFAAGTGSNEASYIGHDLRLGVTAATANSERLTVDNGDAIIASFSRSGGSAANTGIAFAGASSNYFATGIDTSGRMSWKYNSEDLSSSPLMVLDTAGNLGINGAPSERLTIHETANSTDLVVALRTKTAAAASTRSIWTQGANNGDLTLAIDQGSNGSARAFILKMVATEMLRVNATGQLLVGTTTGHSKLSVVTSALGTTQTDTSGLALVNETAAAAGAQQISPALRLRGYGWKTDATAASQPVDFRAHVVPVQGAAAPTGYLTLQASINGGAYSELLRIGNTQLTASAVVLTDANRQLTTVTALTQTNGGTGRTKLFHVEAIGNGSLTDLPVTHNLGTRDVLVHIYEAATPYAMILTDVEHTDTNTVTVKFTVAPSSGQYRVCVTAAAV